MTNENEIGLDEIVEKPLSDDIVQQMNADDRGRKNVALMIESINPTQANLLERLLATMNIEYLWVTKE